MSETSKQFAEYDQRKVDFRRCFQCRCGARIATQESRISVGVEDQAGHRRLLLADFDVFPLDSAL